MKYETERREIIKACQDMNRRGINQGTSGNISVRVKEGFLLTPSGMAYDEMKAGDIVLMRLDASHDRQAKAIERMALSPRADGQPPGSRRGRAHAIRCSPPPSPASAWRFPAVHYMVAAAGGENDPLRALRDLRHAGDRGQRGQGAAGTAMPACSPITA